MDDGGAGPDVCNGDQGRAGGSLDLDRVADSGEGEALSSEQGGQRHGAGRGDVGGGMGRAEDVVLENLWAAACRKHKCQLAASTDSGLPTCTD